MPVILANLSEIVQIIINTMLFLLILALFSDNRVFPDGFCIKKHFSGKSCFMGPL